MPTLNPKMQVVYPVYRIYPNKFQQSIAYCSELWLKSNRVKKFFSRIDVALTKLLLRLFTKLDGAGEHGFAAGSSFGGDLQIKVNKRKTK
jgi:hypothetical protein